jgi:hypothetical protein
LDAGKSRKISLITILCLGVLVFGWQKVAGLTLQLPGQHPSQIGFSKAASRRKMGPMLVRAVAEYNAHRQKKTALPIKSTNSFLRIRQGKILVDAVAVDDSEVLLQDLGRLGLRKGSRYGFIVSGQLPLAVLEKAAALKSLRYISASIPVRSVGDYTSQGDPAMQADVARAVSGRDGTGITVGVLSDSYAQQTGGVTAADDVASNDLPAAAIILDDGGVCTDGIQQQECTDEGRAMAQIIHDVAPGASIAFHTAYNGIADFANGIQELAAAGADVLVDDIFYVGEPMFQDGAIAKAVDNVAAAGVAYFSAAGNQGRDSYEHSFDGSGEILYIDILGFQYWAGEMHDFDPSPGGPIPFSVLMSRRENA